MPYNERKRQYAALRRAVYADASPELVAKYKLSNDSERLTDPNTLKIISPFCICLACMLTQPFGICHIRLVSIVAPEVLYVEELDLESKFG